MAESKEIMATGRRKCAIAVVIQAAENARLPLLN